MPNGSIPGVAVGINFGGSDDATKAFDTLKRYRPNGPFLNSEFWDGWFDHWGGKHAHTDAQKQASNLQWMLERGYSVSLYMFHGGTSFGWMNGANSNGRNYEPDVTSYDYDSPLDESGRPTPKYFLFRDVIQKVTQKQAPEVPSVSPPTTIPAFELREGSSLWDSLPKPIHTDKLPTMEDLDQAYGYVLYRTVLPGSVSGELVLDQLHDYAQIYLNGELAGTLDRRLGTNRVQLNSSRAQNRLEILVENTGRVNFTAVLRGERKGITNQVTLAGKPLGNWDVYSLPMANVSELRYSNKPCSGPCFYRGRFTADHPGDTFLDTSHFVKGEVWLNGRALGRVWNIGPQETLYVPGPWLKHGENEIVVFDLKGEPGRSLQGLEKPEL